MSDTCTLKGVHSLVGVVPLVGVASVVGVVNEIGYWNDCLGILTMLLRGGAVHWLLGGAANGVDWLLGIRANDCLGDDWLLREGVWLLVRGLWLPGGGANVNWLLGRIVWLLRGGVWLHCNCTNCASDVIVSLNSR